MRGDFITVYKFLNGKKNTKQALQQRSIAETNGWKLKSGKCKLEIILKFLTMKVLNHWNKVSRKVVDFLFLVVFKTGCLLKVVF